MTTVGENQNLIDVALTNYGSRWLEGMVEMLNGNADLNLDNESDTGTELETPNVDLNDFVLQTYKANKYRVSTKVGTTNYQLVPEGDFMLTPEGQKIIFI